MTIDPASGLSRPTSVLRNTDLPVPEGPSMTEISPAGSVRVTSRQIVCEPKVLVRPVTAISTPMWHSPVSLSPSRLGYGGNDAIRRKLRTGSVQGARALDAALRPLRRAGPRGREDGRARRVLSAEADGAGRQGGLLVFE